MDDLIYVRLGTGVGAGFVHQGKLFLGSAYEPVFGHCTIDPNGPLCRCGNRGCLEVFTSGPALAARAQESIREGNASILTDLCGGQVDLITAQMLTQAAQQGDVLAGRVLAEMGAFLGIAIATLVNLYAPQIVVLGGPVSQAWPFFIEPLRERVHRHALGLLARDLRLEQSVLGSDAGPVGAATMISAQLNELLERPKPHTRA